MNALITSDRVITRRLRALADTLPAAFEAAPSGIHKARVASRRVREALPIVLAQAPSKKAARLRRSFRRVTRALGPVRELDVTLGLLDEGLQGDEAAIEALAGFRRSLEADRASRRVHMLAQLDAIDFEVLVERIEHLMDERADETEEAHTLPAAIAGTLGVRVARRVRGLRVAVENAGPLYAPEALHAVRITVKKLRYALELAHEMRDLPSRRPLTRLRAAQDLLGHLHDDEVLVGRLRSAENARPIDDEPARRAVGDLIARIEVRCRERHARYVSGRDRLLAAAESALEALSAAQSRRTPPESPVATVH